MNETQNPKLDNQTNPETLNIKKGRKTLSIEFPANNSFTFEDVFNFNANKISKATIRSRMNKMIIENKLGIGQSIQSGTVGRPKFLYFVKS